MRNGERGIGVGSLWSLQCRRASKVGLVGVGVQVMFTSNLDQASNQKWGINVVLQKSIAVNNWWQSSRYAHTAVRQDAPELMEPTSMWKALLAHVDQNTSQVQGDKRIDLAMSQVQTCKTAVAQRYRMKNRMSYKTSMAEHVHLMELKGRWKVFLACARCPHNTPISPKCILALADWIALAAVGRAVWNAAPEGQHKHVHCFVALHRECIQKIKWMTPIIRFPDALAMGGSSLRLLHALADQDVSLLHHRRHATAGLLWMALATSDLSAAAASTLAQHLLDSLQDKRAMGELVAWIMNQWPLSDQTALRAL